ncbi:hypothetical protein DPM19_31695 [Actinomadura craniellae]|uniref:DUF3040 domain-containing protein n=2 Tax=Actinomadura craniellae TaxID=2231787 RepID=A0A365GW85_9ACTN|nr:hypothetical protein DPM19_31695 [Actinomadura craniellae]
MALSMEEQRILLQIETHLTQEDPQLARRLSAPVAQRRGRWVVVGAVVAVAMVVAGVVALVS